MGGGGNYSGRSLSESQERLAKKEAEAKRILEQEAATRRNLFLSFAYEDIDEANLFRAQARSRKSPINFVDRSVREPFDSSRAEYIQQRISERIKQSSMTVVLLSEATSKSRWVEWEIRRSLALGKKVVAFHVGVKPPTLQPDVIREMRIPVVPWSHLKHHISQE